MPQLTGREIGEIAVKVFRERSMSLSDAGARYDLDDMTSAIRDTRQAIRSKITALPDTAFDAQPPAEGEAAWSAGQIVAHLSNAQRSMSGAVRALLEMPTTANGAALDLDALPSREDAMTIFDSVEAEFDDFVEQIPGGADLTRSAHHTRFGEMSTNGWMILMTLHEADHLRQIGAFGS